MHSVLRNKSPIVCIDTPRVYVNTGARPLNLTSAKRTFEQVGKQTHHLHTGTRCRLHHELHQDSESSTGFEVSAAVLSQFLLPTSDAQSRGVAPAPFGRLSVAFASADVGTPNNCSRHVPRYLENVIMMRDGTFAVRKSENTSVRQVKCLLLDQK